MLRELQLLSLLGQPPLRCSESLLNSEQRSESSQSDRKATNPPPSCRQSLPLKRPVDRGGWATAEAGYCLQASYRFQHFQLLKRAHFFRSPPYGGEHLGAGNLHIFQNLIHATLDNLQQTKG